MVCVAVKGEPLIGVIHKPYSKETYWAFVGNGKSSNLVYEMVHNLLDNIRVESQLSACENIFCI